VRVIPNPGQSWRFARIPPNVGEGGVASTTGVRGYHKQSTECGLQPRAEAARIRSGADLDMVHANLCYNGHNERDNQQCVEEVSRGL
jgi:hypothetical protein